MSVDREEWEKLAVLYFSKELRRRIKENGGASLLKFKLGSMMGLAPLYIRDYLRTYYKPQPMKSFIKAHSAIFIERYSGPNTAIDVVSHLTVMLYVHLEMKVGTDTKSEKSNDGNFEKLYFPEKSILSFTSAMRNYMHENNQDVVTKNAWGQIFNEFSPEIRSYVWQNHKTPTVVSFLNAHKDIFPKSRSGLSVRVSPIEEVLDYINKTYYPATDSSANEELEIESDDDDDLVSDEEKVVLLYFASIMTQNGASLDAGSKRVQNEDLLKWYNERPPYIGHILKEHAASFELFQDLLRLHKRAFTEWGSGFDVKPLENVIKYLEKPVTDTMLNDETAVLHMSNGIRERMDLNNSDYIHKSDLAVIFNALSSEIADHLRDTYGTRPLAKFLAKHQSIFYQNEHLQMVGVENHFKVSKYLEENGELLKTESSSGTSSTPKEGISIASTSSFFPNKSVYETLMTPTKRVAIEVPSQVTENPISNLINDKKQSTPSINPVAPTQRLLPKRNYVDPDYLWPSNVQKPLTVSSPKINADLPSRKFSSNSFDFPNLPRELLGLSWSSNVVEANYAVSDSTWCLFSSAIASKTLNDNELLEKEDRHCQTISSGNIMSSIIIQ